MMQGMTRRRKKETMYVSVPLNTSFKGVPAMVEPIMIIDSVMVIPPVVSKASAT